MIVRELENIVKNRLNKGKAIVIMGARQVGKTTLVKGLFKGSNEVIWLNGDELDVQNLFENILFHLSGYQKSTMTGRLRHELRK